MVNVRVCVFVRSCFVDLRAKTENYSPVGFQCALRLMDVRAFVQTILWADDEKKTATKTQE